jgi:hypothetical protein
MAIKNHAHLDTAAFHLHRKHLAERNPISAFPICFGSRKRQLEQNPHTVRADVGASYQPSQRSQ